jgi:phasin
MKPGQMPNPFDVPVEMRDFAAKSVEQTRRAFESFMGAARQAGEGMTKGVGTGHAGATEAGSAMMDMAEANVKAALDLAEKLVNARGMDEVLAHQTEFLRQQIETVQGQAQAMGTIIQKATTPSKG